MFRPGPQGDLKAENSSTMDVMLGRKEHQHNGEANLRKTTTTKNKKTSSRVKHEFAELSTLQKKPPNTNKCAAAVTHSTPTVLTVFRRVGICIQASFGRTLLLRREEDGGGGAEPTTPHMTHTAMLLQGPLSRRGETREGTEDRKPALGLDWQSQQQREKEEEEGEEEKAGHTFVR